MAEGSPLLEFVDHGTVTVGTVVNTHVLDGSNVETFGQQALAYVQDGPGLHLLINFENVRFISSAALTELLRLNHFLKGTQGSVHLCNLNSDILNVFKITNLDKLFVIYQDTTAAAAAERFAEAIQGADETGVGSNPNASG